MKLFRVSTSAWKEEDFFLVTDLTWAEIDLVLVPMLEAERKDEHSVVPNEEYCSALQKVYPTAYIRVYNVDIIPLLSY